MSLTNSLVPPKHTGVFFQYEISPMLVHYEQFRKPFTHFLTDVCSIVGGVFTVAGLVDSFVYSAERAIKEKSGLGKSR
jgi:endoplasmic reticulum-Golgi intermediate compartment protein 3